MSPRGAYKAETTKKNKAQTLGARVRSVRLKWGWPQAEMARVLGVPQQSISSWERDKTDPLGPSMANLCRLFRMTEDELRRPGVFKVPEPPEPDLLVLHCPQRPEGHQDLVLPEPEHDRVVHVALADGGIQFLSVEEAVKSLRKAVKVGDHVWLVVKMASPPD
jgi:DNA-binding XRE family transcriptional regulator